MRVSTAKIGKTLGTESEKSFKRKWDRLKRAVFKDWVFYDEDGLRDPEKFLSMHTNIFGECWWCRMEDDAKGRPQLLVWGDDVSVARTRTGSQVKMFPWIMHEEEQLWLRANLSRLKLYEEGGGVRGPS